MKAELETQYRYDAGNNIWVRAGSGEKFGYSDGDESENRVYRIIKSASDKSVFSPELASKITDWASLYHLSPERGNVIRPIIDRIEGPVLEIGSGCGAITRFLGEQGLEVVAVEGSLRRAATGAERCRDLPNVNVVVDAFQNFDVGRKFKTITLIGVLEYARMFFERREGCDPIDLMLERVAGLLEPGGMLIVAIENQLGLKYFAGFAEDHLNQPMIGIESRYTSRSAVTFGRKELRRRVAAVGLGSQEWWYPFPDYKIPMSILSDEAFEEGVPANFTSLIGAACGTDAQTPGVLNFSMDFAWKAVVENGLVGDLANSFVLAASAEEIPKARAFGFHYGGKRDPAYKKTVEFGRDDDGYYVTRFRTAPDLAVDENAELFLSLGREPMREGDLWRDELFRIVARDNWNIGEIGHWGKIWWQALVREIGNRGGNIPIAATDLIPGIFFDALPRNLVVDTEGEAAFIDQEWIHREDLEAGCLLFRGLFDAFQGVRFGGRTNPGIPREMGALIVAVAREMGFEIGSMEMIRYLSQESRFQSIASGRPIRIDPQSILGRPIPTRTMPVQIIQHQQQALKVKNDEVAQLVAATQDTHQKIESFKRTVEARLTQADQLLREKDEQIMMLRAGR